VLIFVKSILPNTKVLFCNNLLECTDHVIAVRFHDAKR